jgi:Ser/Thr protein kinase RdoA (MazF antagonist)
MLVEAITSYGLPEPDAWRSVPQNWHRDIHLCAYADGAWYSIRLVRRGRPYSTTPATALDDCVLRAQLRFGDRLADAIPFMRRVAPADGHPWHELSLGGIGYRIVVFAWCSGVSVPSRLSNSTQRIGSLLRAAHDAAAEYVDDNLPSTHSSSHHAAYAARIRDAAERIDRPAELDRHLGEAQRRISLAERCNGDAIAVHGDYNTPNLLWDAGGTISGVVDFDHIGRSSRVAELAWALKWHVRDEGGELASIERARALLAGYGSSAALRAESAALPAFAWLTIGMNFSVMDKLCDAFAAGDASRIRAIVDDVSRRAAELERIATAVADV